MTAIGNPELFTVAPDEVSVTFVTVPHESVTTRVGDHEVTTTGPYHVARITGLEPDTAYPLDRRRRGAERAAPRRGADARRDRRGAGSPPSAP